MPSLLPSVGRSGRCSWLAGALLLLAVSGCHSARPTFSFRPAAPAVASPAPPAPPASPAPAPEVVPPAPPARSGHVARVRQPKNWREPRGRQQLARRLVQAAARPAVASLGAASHRGGPQAMRAAAFKPRTRAEVGLGTTVLGVLGLVVLPLALLGLLIWGGAVWAVLAGLSALAVLVAWLDPFA